MNIGIYDSNMTNYYMNGILQKANSGRSKLTNPAGAENVDFNSVISAKSADAIEDSVKAEVSFKDMLQSKYPGAYYHVMDASQIQQGVWERHDFPFEKFFQNDADPSVVEWMPNGAAPKLADDSVQSRLHSIAGQKSIVVPPELEEKMANDPALAQKVMATVDKFVAENQVPGRICSHLIVFDKDGEIAHYRASSHGGNFVESSPEELEQFKREQTAKAKRREKNEQLAREAALKRAEMEQEQRSKQIKHDLLKTSNVSSIIAAYESSFMMTDKNLDG